MQRQTRLDASGVLHDVMARGIEPHSIFIKRGIGHGSHEKVLPVKYVVYVPHIPLSACPHRQVGSQRSSGHSPDAPHKFTPMSGVHNAIKADGL